MAKTGKGKVSRPRILNTSGIDRVENLLRTKVESVLMGRDPIPSIKKIFSRYSINGIDRLEKSAFLELCRQEFAITDEFTVLNSALFDRYDTGNTSILSSADFLNCLFNQADCIGRPTVGKIRRILQEREGGPALKNTLRQFSILDRNGGGYIDRMELSIGINRLMKSFDLNLRSDEIDKLVSAFDLNRDGLIDYKAFVYGLRGSMNARRTGMVRKAWKLMQLPQSSATLQEVVSHYEVLLHPAVVQGDMNAEQVLSAFTSVWDFELEEQVREEDFLDALQWISCSIVQDTYFELYMHNTWRVGADEDLDYEDNTRRVLLTQTDGQQAIEVLQSMAQDAKTDAELLLQSLVSTGRNISQIDCFQ